jgi:hypothetical protein
MCGNISNTACRSDALFEDLRYAMEEASAPSETPARAEGKRDSEV